MQSVSPRLPGLSPGTHHTSQNSSHQQRYIFLYILDVRYLSFLYFLPFSFKHIVKSKSHCNYVKKGGNFNLSLFHVVNILITNQPRMKMAPTRAPNLMGPGLPNTQVSSVHQRRQLQATNPPQNCSTNQKCPVFRNTYQMAPKLLLLQGMELLHYLIFIRKYNKQFC